MPQLEGIQQELNYQSPEYKSAYSRINALVIEGEKQAYNNYLRLAEMLSEDREELQNLAKMENRHKKGFESCARNLQVTPDMDFAEELFRQLQQNFDKAAAEGKIVTCLLIQGLIVECFAIAAYNIYIPVADPFARKITEGVVKDEYQHRNYTEEWLGQNLETYKTELEAANQENLPLVWQMLSQVEEDVETIGMEKDALVEDFMIAYGEALENIGFTTREIMRMSAYGLRRA